MLARSLRMKSERVRDLVPRALRLGMEEILAETKARTARGVAVNERPFTPYRPATAARKGRTQPVTLRATGDMIEGMRIRELAPTRLELGFASTRQARKAYFHHLGTRRMAQRMFFGVGPRLARRVTQRVGGVIHQAMASGGGTPAQTIRLVG